MKTAAFFILALFALLALPACGGDDDDATPAAPVPTDIQTADTQATDTQTADSQTADSQMVDTGTPLPEGALTLANCETSIGTDVGDFYSTYFKCVNIEVSADGTTLSTDGLPPHPSPYYPETDPNYVEFDDRGGSHYKNPGEIAAIDYSMTIPANPVPKGITIDASMVDNMMGTSDEEYAASTVGIALNGVAIFAAMAAGNDVLAEEAFTFDLYEGHPAGSTYHYHFETPGPLEVLVDRGISNSSEPGAGAVELYGIMCDGTVVLGCTELDGSEPDDSDFDAQNGQIGDISDGTTTFFEDRYHVHVCPDKWPDYPFFPEIAYYETTSCVGPGGGGGGQGPPPGGGPPGP